jgi:hypothetical protein
MWLLNRDPGEVRERTVLAMVFHSIPTSRLHAVPGGCVSESLSHQPWEPKRVAPALQASRCPAFLAVPTAAHSDMLLSSPIHLPKVSLLLCREGGGPSPAQVPGTTCSLRRCGSSASLTFVPSQSPNLKPSGLWIPHTSLLEVLPPWCGTWPPASTTPLRQPP